MRTRTPPVIGLLSLLVWIPTASLAQQPAVNTDLQPLSEQITESLDLSVDEIALQKTELALLRTRMSEAEGIQLEVLSTRHDRLWTSMFRDTLSVAKILITNRDAGRDISAYFGLITEELRILPASAYDSVERLRTRVVFPTSEMEPEELVLTDQELFQHIQELDDIFNVLMLYTAIAEDFGLDASSEREYLTGAAADSTASRSIFLEIAIRDVENLRNSVATLPDSTNLADRLRAAQTRVRLTATAMQGSIALMNQLGLETRQYRQQLLTVTGEITTDVLDVSIIASLLSDWTRTAVDTVTTEGPRIVFRLLLVLLIFFAFFQFAKLVQKGVERGLASSRVQVSNLLKRMIVSSVRNIIIAFGFLIAISQLGISLGPLLAGLGIAGFIIGFALQDSLANFASGLMILLYKPFDVGDVVDAGGVKGRVSTMNLVNTTFMTLDNQRLVVPNNLIWQSVITNVTAQRTRRIDMIFGIAYSDDLEKAQRVLQEVLEANETVLEHPLPVVRVHELGDSSVNFAVRPWVKTGDYWETYWELTKQVKLRFDEEGLSIPFPQQDVHLFQPDKG